MSWDKKTPWPQVRFIFDGKEYRWSGWFGCQLESFEWKTLPAGTQRAFIFGSGTQKIDMTIFTTKREGLKVRTTWAVSSSGTHAEHTARIYALQDALKKLV